LPATIDGGGGADALALTASDAADTVTVAAALVTLNGAAWRYANIEDLSVSTLGGPDSITVEPAAAGFPARRRIDAGNDGDDVLVHLAAGAAARIDVEGGAQADTLTVRGTAGNDTIVVDGATLVSGGLAVGFRGIESLTVDGADGDDALSLTGGVPGGAARLEGGGGDGRLAGAYPLGRG